MPEPVSTRPWLGFACARTNLVDTEPCTALDGISERLRGKDTNTAIQTERATRLMCGIGSGCRPTSKQHFPSCLVTRPSPQNKHLRAWEYVPVVKCRVTCYNQPMIIGFKHKGLRDYYERGSTKGIRADQSRRISIILADLDAATSLDDLSRPSLRLHELKGERKGTWSVSVNGAWRITFTHDDGKFDVLDLEQYH